MFPDLIISGYMLFALNTPSVFPLRDIDVPEPSLSAKSVLVFDVSREKFLYTKSIHQPLPMASLAKLLSSLVVLDAIPLDKVITLDQRAIDTFGDAGDFRIGEKVEARHLLFASLIQSSNDAMMGLAYDLGIENFLSLLRSKVLHLGLKRTVLVDPVGLSSQTSASASDLLQVLRLVFTNEFIRQVLSIPEYTFKSASGRYHKMTSTNDLIFDPRVIAAKTGSLRDVGQNYAALVKRSGGDDRLVILLLGSEDRTKDTLSLLNWLDKGFVWR